jgi:hypothetical protein
LLCPPDVIERSLPMVAPLPLSMPELEQRQIIDRLLQECWGSDDGFEVSLSDEWIVNGGSFLEEEEAVKVEAHIRPSTYGEITPPGVWQLFHHMGMTSPKRKTNIAFVDLGSGAGKLVAQAYLELKHLKHAVGRRWIEGSALGLRCCNHNMPPIRFLQEFLRSPRQSFSKDGRRLAPRMHARGMTDSVTSLYLCLSRISRSQFTLDGCLSRVISVALCDTNEQEWTALHNYLI